MFCKLVLLVILASLHPGKTQEEQPTPDEGCDGVAVLFDEIKDLLNTIKSRTGAHNREFRSFRNQVESDLRSLKDDMASLNDSVVSLNNSFQEQLIRQQEMAMEIAHQQTSLAIYTQQVNTTMNSLSTILHNQTSFSMTQSLITTQNQQANDKMDKINFKLDQLNASLSHHEEETQNNLVEVQTLFTDTNSKLDATTTQLFSDHQQIQNSISDVECMDREESLQLHQSLQSNLTHRLDSIHSHTSTLLSSYMDIITNRTVSNNTSSSYTCGGTGGWRRVVYLDMTDPSTTCPSGWQETVYSKRTCGKVSTQDHSCDSVTFPVSGGGYSQVCGRIKAYQLDQVDAFEAYDDGHVTTIDGAYVSGVSVTHGNPRRHIWTFAAGASEAHRTRDEVCPCDASVPISIPPFVGSDYFCESGANTGRYAGFNPDDPLWDGQNCVSSSTCCSFNTPPYFSKQLPTPTTDSIEVRLCRWEGSHDDSPIELIELYVQ